MVKELSKKKRVSIHLDEDLFELIDEYVKRTEYKTKQKFFVKIAEEKLKNNPKTNNIREYLKDLKTKTPS
jgi:metal-responsive CopG/Arc/MetJ family transcriptional regulator